MTSQSKSDRVEQQVLEALDQSNEAMPQTLVDEIAAARRQALLRAKAASDQTQGNTSGFGPWLIHTALQWRLQFAIPAALAVTLAVLVSYDPQSSVPVLPSNMLVADVPTEDLALLEDLEFASWLAEQDSEVVL